MPFAHFKKIDYTETTNKNKNGECLSNQVFDRSLPQIV
jgi:hypothetical protein